MAHPRLPFTRSARVTLAAALCSAVLGAATASSPAWAASDAPPPAAGVASPAPAVAQAWSFVSTAACPNSRFTCVTLAVPRDHAAAFGPTWDVTFAIQRATGTRKGVFVTITGGPGTSGLAAADSYTDAFDPAITQSYDIVFLDQRGVGLSHPIGCPTATAAYYRNSAQPGTPAATEAAGAAAQTYVTDCLAEAKADTADLPFYSTAQAVEDLEAFRQYLGVDRLYLYGESYGTQYVQTYAAAHPDHVAALFVDGPVDLTIDGPTYQAEAARAFSDALTATLADCQAHRSCAADLGAVRASTAYDDLARRLAAGPVTFRFPTAHGTFVTRQLSLADLESAASGYLYTQFSRMLLQRAITAAAAGDDVPLARLAYDSEAVDPETLAAVDDPTFSDAMYYATECQDYAYFPSAGSTAARLQAWRDAATAAGLDGLRLGAIFYGDLPCLYWPAQPPSDPRVPPLVHTSYPIFVLTATLDPATPMANAMRMYGRANDAYLFITTGGPHVTFGRGVACPDVPITHYLATGSLPATRITVCPGRTADPYVRNARRSASQYASPLDLMASMDDQILNTDDYNYRLGDSPITMGCDRGGTLRYRPASSGTALTLTRCAFTPSLALTGSGRIGDDGSLVLDVRLPAGHLHYLRDADGNVSVRGTYEGRTVSLSR